MEDKVQNNNICKTNEEFLKLNSSINHKPIYLGLYKGCETTR